MTDLFDVSMTEPTESALLRALSAASSVVYVPGIRQQFGGLVHLVLNTPDGIHLFNGGITATWSTTNGIKKARVHCEAG